MALGIKIPSDYLFERLNKQKELQSEDEGLSLYVAY